MNRKQTTLTTLAILILITFTSACTDAITSSETLPEIPDRSALIQSAKAYLPEGIEFPALLPTMITDPQLLAAWVYLFNQSDLITVWDQNSWTGQQLAQFLLDKDIPVSWSTPDVCTYSCTKRPSSETDDFSQKNKIYMDPTLKGDSIQNIASTLGHEAYHASEPFGKVKDTLFEEYWAFKVGSAISGESWGPLVEGDEYKPVCLHKWFGSKGFVASYEMPEYPQQISSQILPEEENCSYQANINPDAVVTGP